MEDQRQKSLDLLTVATWLSPGFLMPLAERAYGHTTVDRGVIRVMGAPAAFSLVRGMVRAYLKYVKHRDGQAGQIVKEALPLRAIGYGASYQTVTLASNLPLWRKTASEIWKTSDPSIPGVVRLRTNLPQSVFDALLIQTCSTALSAIPDLNRALLQGHLWHRYTPEVLVTLSPGFDHVTGIVLRANQYESHEIVKRLSAATKSAIRSRPYWSLASQLFGDWAKAGGMINSPAGMMISCVGSQGIVEGSSALLTNTNGIPIAVTVGKIVNGEVAVSVNVDHRVFDSRTVGKFHNFLRDRFGGA